MITVYCYKLTTFFSSHHCRQSGKEIILGKIYHPLQKFLKLIRESIIESKSFNELNQSNLNWTDSMYESWTKKAREFLLYMQNVNVHVSFVLSYMPGMWIWKWGHDIYVRDISAIIVVYSLGAASGFGAALPAISRCCWDAGLISASNNKPDFPDFLFYDKYRINGLPQLIIEFIVYNRWYAFWIH